MCLGRVAVSRELFGQKFERDWAAELRVPSLADDSHAPAELLKCAVVGNGLSDHEAIASHQDVGDPELAPAYAACTGNSAHCGRGTSQLPWRPFPLGLSLKDQGTTTIRTAR
jgi:hypothetical protein